jgi:hypothetical protein
MAARKPSATQSWDDFWAEQQSDGPTEVIRGVTVPVPTDMPLGYEARLAELHDADTADVMDELIDGLFGAGVYQQWVTAGMGVQELLTVLTWGMCHAGGREVTFAEAREIALSGDEGKAPNRAARRAASKPRSASTGGRSRPTSSASTGSARKTSRG